MYRVCTIEAVDLTGSRHASRYLKGPSYATILFLTFNNDIDLGIVNNLQSDGRRLYKSLHDGRLFAGREYIRSLRSPVFTDAIYILILLTYFLLILLIQINYNTTYQSVWTDYRALADAA